MRSVHKLGVKHGDLHAGNFLVAADGRVMLLDFDRAEVGQRGCVGGGGPFVAGLLGLEAGLGQGTGWTMTQLWVQALPRKETQLYMLLLRSPCQ